MSRLPRALTALAGLVLAAVAFALLASALALPNQYDIFQPRWPEAISISGLTRPELLSLGARLLLLGPALLLLSVWVPDRPLSPPSPPASAAIAAVLVTFAAVWALRGFPIVDDEATYQMQAELLADGRLADPPTPPNEQWHREPFTVFTPKATTGKYLFGTPLGLVPGLWLGFPPLMHVVFAAWTVLLVAAGLRRAGASQEAQRWAALLMAVSPMFVLTEATLQSQAPALFGVAALVWGLQRDGFRSGLLSGIAFGLALSARPQLALPCLAALLLRYGWSRRRFFAGVFATTAPWLLLILAYNHAITGDALTLPGAFYNSERYGFGEVDGQPPHTLWRGVLIGLAALVRMNAWALGWPVSLLAAIVWLLQGRAEQKGVAPWAWIALTTFLFQAGYYFGGINDTGPIYYFAALPFVVTATAATLPAYPRWTKVALASLALGTTSFLIEHAVRLRGLTDLVAEPIRTAERAEARALVFVERSLVGSDPRGQVRGVPLRTRTEETDHLFYPRPGLDSGAIEALQSRWSDRPCRYLWYEQGRWQLTDCDRMQTLGREFDRREPPWF